MSHQKEKRRAVVVREEKYRLSKICRAHTEEAVMYLLRVLRDPDTGYGARLKAIEILFERGYGKAAQSVEVFADDGEIDVSAMLTIRDKIARLREARERKDEQAALPAPRAASIIEGELAHEVHDAL